MNFTEILDSVKAHLTDEDYEFLKDKLENCQDDVTTEILFDNKHENFDKIIHIAEFDAGDEGLRYMVQLGRINLDVDREFLEDIFTGVCVAGIKLKDRAIQSSASVSGRRES